MSPFHLLTFKKLAIFQQLQIEEALVRADDRNWVILNLGTAPAIVMGISGKQEELLNHETLRKKPIPIIRRFSGGGTVVVDEQTHFCTLIGNRSILDFPCYPKEVMRWTEKLYLPAFAGLPFSLCDHDYAIEDRKCGGNAQYFSKDRWLHHSSLLWDFHEERMEYLLMPPKMPTYRRERSHKDFLCRLRDHFPTEECFKSKILEALGKQFELIPTSFSSVEALLGGPHRKATKFLCFND